MPRFRPLADVEDMQTRHERGDSYAAIGRAYGIKGQTVKSILRRAAKPGPRGVEIDDLKLVIAYVGQGIRGHRLAAKFGVTHAAVNHRLRAAGVTIHRRGHPKGIKLRRYSDEEIQEAVWRGVSVEGAASILGCDPQTIARRVARAAAKNKPCPGCKLVAHRTVASTSCAACGVPAGEWCRDASGRDLRADGGHWIHVERTAAERTARRATRT